MNNKTILITGGTGSFGTAFCNLILSKYNPKKLIIFSRDELKQYHLSLQKNFIQHKKKLGFLFDHKQNSSEKNLNNFIEKVLSTKKYIFNLDGHLLPQFMYVYDENKKQIPEVIIRYENLKDDFLKFVRHYKLNVDIQELEKTHLLKSNSKLTIQNLNKKSIELINKYYNLDFQYLNYSKIE